MRQLKAKLRSRRGASITFALLLFLVCAVISTVVVVSASTVGGRASGMKENDQRYFAATEAARKLQTIFDNQTVTVTYNDADHTKAPAATAPTGVSGILASASEQVVKTAVVAGTDAVQWQLKNNIVDGDYTCAITATLDKGLLSFDILASGPQGGRNDGVYKLSIVFASDLKKPDANGATSATAKVSWSLHSLSKGRAPELEPTT